MKKNQSQDDGPLHQTVAEGIEFKVGVKSIAVEFTEQQLSAHAGQCHVLGVVAFDAVGGGAGSAVAAACAEFEPSSHAPRKGPGLQPRLVVRGAQAHARRLPVPSTQPDRPGLSANVVAAP